MKRYVDKYQIPHGRVSADIFALPCVTSAFKTYSGGIGYHLEDGYSVYEGEWLCRDEDGKWEIFQEHDEP